MHALLDFVLYTIIVTTELHGKYIIQNGSISLVAKYKKNPKHTFVCGITH